MNELDASFVLSFVFSLSLWGCVGFQLIKKGG